MALEKLKLKSADTGRYTKAKGADPKTTYKSDDYPTKMLRKMVKLIDNKNIETIEAAKQLFSLSAQIKKRMGWK